MGRSSHLGSQYHLAEQLPLPAGPELSAFICDMGFLSHIFNPVSLTEDYSSVVSL